MPISEYLRFIYFTTLHHLWYPFNIFKLLVILFIIKTMFQKNVFMYFRCYSSILLTAFCSSNMDSPHDIYSRDGCIKIVSKISDPSTSYFSLRYTSMSSYTTDFPDSCRYFFFLCLMYYITKTQEFLFYYLFY